MFDSLAAQTGGGATLTGVTEPVQLRGGRALALTRLMGNLLYNVSPQHPATMTAVAVTLATVAGLAAYVPARRATKIDPVVALRFE